jgi:hypothetical protein
MVSDMAVNIALTVDPFLLGAAARVLPYATLVTGPAVRPVICTCYKRTLARGAVERDAVQHCSVVRPSRSQEPTFRRVRHAE